MKVMIFDVVKKDNNISMHVYATNLIEHLRQHADVSMKIETASVTGRKLPIIKDLLSKELFYPIYAKLKAGEINHIVDHSYGGLAYFLNPARTVVTCHDLIPLEVPSQSSWLGKKRFLHNIFGMLRAGNIIADSESTKSIILKHFDFKGRIHVIYPGINRAFMPIEDSGNARSRLRDKIGLDKGRTYLLHVGNSNPSKNIELLLKTLARLPEMRLLKVGSFNPGQEKLIKELGLKNRIALFSGLTLPQLIELYNVSDLFLFPSLCEGFGFPVLEAMASGCPVICSKTGSLPEVGGDAARYIDPYSPKDMEISILEVLSNKSMRNDMIEKGFRQAAEFTWNKTASKVVEVYMEMSGLK